VRLQHQRTKLAKGSGGVASPSGSLASTTCSGGQPSRSTDASNSIIRAVCKVWVGAG
jgi:hypothetical protein